MCPTEPKKSRIREAVGELGKGMATQVSETARVGANSNDIKWQVSVFFWFVCVDALFSTE